MLGEDDVSQEIYALAQFPDGYLLRMQREREPIAEERRHRLNQVFQIRVIRRRNCKIVGIAGIMPYMKFVLNKLIEFVHVDIREELGGKIADGHTLRGAAFTLSLSLSLSIGVV